MWTAKTLIRLGGAHMSFCWFCHALAQLSMSKQVFVFHTCNFINASLLVYTLIDLELNANVTVH